MERQPFGVLVVAALVGDGSPGDARRATIWGRLDNAFEVISTGNWCLKPDGTVDVARIKQVRLSMPIVHDLGPVGVVRQQMATDAWGLIVSQIEREMGYAVWGHTDRELLDSIAAAQALIRQHVTDAGLDLPVAATEYDSVVELLTKPRYVRLFVGDGMLLLRRYYANRLQGTGVEFPERLIRDGGTLDPAQLSTLRDLYRGKARGDLAVLLHELYDLAAFDLVARSVA